jgi:adenylate cyclase
LSARTRARLISLGVGIAAASACAIPGTWIVQENIDLYALFHLRGTRPLPPEVVIVPIDRRAAQAISVLRDPQGRAECRDVRIGEEPGPAHETLPPGHLTSRWPRCLHARVVEALKRAGASVIVLDILFRPLPGAIQSGQAAGASGDQMLADAMTHAANVILAQRLDGEHEHPVEISEILGNAAVGQAPFLLPKTNPSFTHTFWTVKESGWDAIGLPLLALQLRTLDLYPRLYAALRQEAPDHAQHLPASSEQIRLTGQLEAVSLMLRATFAADATLPRRVLTVLGRPEHADLTPEQRAALRALVAGYAGPPTRYFNLYGPPGTVQVVRYERLLAGDDLPALQGRIAFVGLAEYSQPEQYEHFPTVWPDSQGIDNSGVELAATAFSNLYREDTMRPLAAWWRAALCILIASAVAWVCFVAPSRRALLIVLAIGLAYLATALFAFDHRALWLPIAAILGVSIPLAVAVAFTVQHVELKRQYASLYKVFGLFVPRNVLERLAHNAERMAWFRESVFGACVATDGERYTALAERMSPEELARFLNRYFETLFPPVASTQGWVSDVVGDSMLAVWAEPRPSAEVRRRACSAALEILAASERFNAESTDGRMPTRIGVDFGPLTLTTIGAGGHWEYRPVGAVPTTANRLQDLNKRLRTRLLVSESTLVGVADLAVRDLGWFLLRGKSAPIRVYELLGNLGQTDDAQLRLCREFGPALESFQGGRLDEARRRFEDLLDSFPEDGPSRFFAQLCGTGAGFADGVIIEGP